MPCSLTRTFTFYATHGYPGSDVHGHHYRIGVTVTGPLDPVRRMVIDLDALDGILTEAVTSRLDHRHLNDTIPAFRDGSRWPSCEALAEWCWQEIASRLPGQSRLERIRVAEDDTLWADCTGTA
ncbi:MAG: 6-carboxytetrahydropterin synthase [Gemmatimonadota bacterium]